MTGRFRMMSLKNGDARMKRLKTTATLTAVLLWSSVGFGTSHAQPMVFPGAEWETATPESQYVDSSLLQSAVNYLAANLTSGGGVNEFVIIRNGRMIWEGPESDNVHHIYSATKSFASTALGLLVDDGLVTLDTLARDYVPSMAADYPDVTLQHLATHTSGYRPEEEPYPLPPWYNWRPEAFEDPFAPGPPLFIPGSRYLYSVNGMDQMMNVLTRAAGEPMQDFFQRRIGGPIGLDPSSWDWYDYETSDGLVVEAGSGGISISAKDAARLGHLFLNQGNWNGEQLISSNWVDTATSVQVPASLLEHPNSYSSPLGGVYGFGWWVNGVRANGPRLYPGAPPETFAAQGFLDNHIFIVPEWDMVIVREGSEGWSSTSFGVWSSFFRRIGSALIPEPEADFDGDGDVDGDDFLAWQTGFGIPSGATKTDGDYDNDGDVDGDDFLGWQAEFGSGSCSASGVVPEPASIVLLFVLTTGGLLSTRRWKV